MKHFGQRRDFLLGRALEVSHEALGAWTRMMSYATSDEVESGRLVGARAWNDRRWLICCQVSPSDVEVVVAAGLAVWDGDDLVLAGFDDDGLAALKKKRAQGKHGSKGPQAKKSSKDAQLRTVGEGDPLGKPKGDPVVRIGREGIGEDRIGEEGRRPPASRPLSEADPNSETWLAVIREARDRARRTNPGITTDEEDAAQLCASFQLLTPAERPHVKRATELFYSMLGKRPGDTYWKTCSWSWHMLATQGFTVCLPLAAADANGYGGFAKSDLPETEDEDDASAASGQQTPEEKRAVGGSR